jgi:aryl-alcohol dehydrogenase-like predicted oxidoreductase
MTFQEQPVNPRSEPTVKRPPSPKLGQAPHPHGPLPVGQVALGTASWALHQTPLGSRTAERVLRAALESGVTLVDTALVYSTRDEDSYSERLLARALRSLPALRQPIVATKGGHFRRGDDFVVDGRPETIRENCERSLRALGVETIDLYFLHKPDPNVPLVESVGAIAQLQQAGRVRLVGLSNVSDHELEEARSIVEIAAVQNPLDAGKRDPAIDQCEQLGIAYLGYAPFQGSAHLAARNPGVARIAGIRGVSPQQVIIARHLKSSPAVTAIVGARRPATIRDSAAAAALRLSAVEVELIDAAPSAPVEN